MKFVFLNKCLIFNLSHTYVDHSNIMHLISQNRTESLQESFGIYKKGHGF